LEQLVHRFESAWRNGERPALADYLPAGPSPSRSLLIELVHADLEFRLKAGEPVRVEAYLARYPELTEDATVVRELIAAEYEQRRRREPDLTPGEFLDRFPAHAGALRHRLPPSPDRVASNGDSAPTQLASPSRAAQAWPRIPGYEILGVLGHGGMGVVYR